jgi:hypothetical protein
MQKNKEPVSASEHELGRNVRPAGTGRRCGVSQIPFPDKRSRGDRPGRRWAGQTEACSRVPRSKKFHLMFAPAELLAKIINDPLRSAVRLWRNRDIDAGNLSDLHTKSSVQIYPTETLPRRPLDLTRQELVPRLKWRKPNRRDLILH